MKKLVFFLLVFFLLFSFLLPAQDIEEDNSYNYFLLIPILETAFSGRLEWRPNWPLDFPPDGFYASNAVELSNGDAVFTLRRDSQGRLVTFPLFHGNEYASVQSVFNAAGALNNMTITFINNDFGAEVWNIEFPQDFLPYSILSPGGSFAPLKVTLENDTFFVFIFETPSYLTETWYDSEGNMLIFCKALVRHSQERWRVSSLQIHDYSGVRFEDYFFDSFGNITEIRSDEGVFSALYRENRPIYWTSRGIDYELEWDTRGVLTVKKSRDIEYRYRYEFDALGFWISRQETALAGVDYLLIPSPSFSRGIWTRKIWE